MRQLPAQLEAYKRTPEFTADSIPAGLLKSHSTKSGTWGKIVILEGELLYRILEPELEVILLNPSCYGVVEPCIEHEVSPHGPVRFYVEFFR